MKRKIESSDVCGVEARPPRIDGPTIAAPWTGAGPAYADRVLAFRETMVPGSSVGKLGAVAPRPRELTLTGVQHPPGWEG
jgi:hypothetical protein